ncbi:Predicted arabinose efflux permease, MFS family [Georgenia satyanarayanai]|uniref:Predicted arabinose efflux permease, MFS family n=1 Tax=Georgenia satyanarayanai TaxID=860221 RepID=A0A2Y9A761_9MICO|nr:MFS transporter [Georgenia satyanarayanai]PYG00989.1 putative MFS family arabinose efflux permease [Georgenia satyanarayanai]SSA39228.1 Predicted arabinose efflux permease, MFS family [Georgenia satyanarayanai]
MRSTFDSLKFFNYRLWFAGALVANVGTWMQRVAQDWLVLTVLSNDSGLAVGIVTGLQFLPMLLLSPFGGLLADRLPRRQLLIGTQTALGVLAAGLGVLVLSGHAELWHVYVFALLLGIVTALDNPVRQTFVAEMVPPASLPNAVGLNSASFNAARLIGPGISGLLIAVVGPGWIFIINALSFAATILSLTLMRRDELNEMPHTSRGRGQIREGLRYVRGRSDIVTIMVVVGVVGALGLNFQLTSAVMAREVFGKGAGEYGVLGSILAIGSLGGALLAARRKRPRVRLVLGAAFAFGVASGLMAIMPTYELYALMTIPVGFASLTMMTAANATVQMSTDPAMRGRVMSLYMMVFLGTTPIGAPIVGWVAETFSARWAIGVGAISAIAVSMAAAVWAKRHWDVEVHYRLRHRPHLRMVGPSERARSREEAKARLGAQDAQNATGLA